MERTFEMLVKNSEQLARDDDYEVDGLIHCGKCREKKQCIVTGPNGKQYKPYCLCKCESERIAKEKEEDDRRNRNEKIDRMRKSAFSECRMSSWTFANDDMANKTVTNAMRKYVENFPHMKKKGIGLLLYGNVGTGKTYAASEVLNALIDREIPCLATNFTKLANTIIGLANGKQEFIDSLNRYDVILFDDLGAERESQYMQEQVYNIIDTRYRAGLPMIITTNTPIEQIKQQNNSCTRIYDRILERCFPIEVKGKSRRRQIVCENYYETKDLLGL